MLAIICILVWITVGLFVLGFAMKGEREIIRSRIETLRLTIAEDVEKVVPELSLPFNERVIRTGVRKVTTAISKMFPTDTTAIAAKLEQAGSPWKLQPLEFVGLRALSVMIFLAAGVACVFFVELTPLYKIVALACALIIGYAIPESFLDSTIRERHMKMRKALPDSLDLMVVSAEAGMGFDAALAKVVERTDGILSNEFGRMLQDMAIGRSRSDSLKSMAVRVGLPELTTFVAAIRQADMLGTSIANVLRAQADSLRSSRNIRARESAAKLPVKMLFPLVFCIFPAIFVVLLGPAMLRIMEAFGNMGK